MADPRDDVPLEDYDEQQQIVEDVPDVAAEEMPESTPAASTSYADEGDLLEQSLGVTEIEDYPHGPTEE